MKKILSALLALALVLAFIPGAQTHAASDVRPCTQSFTLDGQAVSCTAYSIDGYNYVMLRHLASLLSGTPKQFSVDWNAGTKTVEITTGQAYVDDGSVTNGPNVALDENGRVPSAREVSQSIQFDGGRVTTFTAYAIGGHNYFKLADLQKELGYGLTYEKATRTVAITTAVGDKLDLTAAADYQDVWAALDAAVSKNGSRYGFEEYIEEDAGAPMMDEPAMAAESAAPAAANGGSRSADSIAETEESDGVDYSATNTQVEGIDEGDVVKTDGKYLYILRQGKLLIAQADGKNTKTLSVTQIGFDEYQDGKKGYHSEYKYPSELYILGDRVAVLSSYSSYGESYVNDRWSWEDTEYTAVDIFDVSNPAKPKTAAQLGQDGYDMGSRLKGDTLYVVTNYSVYDGEEEAPETYVPCLYRDGKAELCGADCLWFGPSVRSANYVVVTAYDLAAGEIAETQSILGGGSTLYMSHNSIYVADSHYDERTSASRTESIYTVTDHREEIVTDLYRFDIASGLAVAASGTVPGGLDDQFSMDEYQNHLRLVTTSDGYGYTIYEDKERGFRNYKWDDGEDSATGLYILDSDLTIVGSVKDLAPNEQVYSARFDGDVAYFCTFRTLDPLFAVDVSDPASPQVLSALKISGFSDYLHPWSDGRLFGAGYEADETTGRREEVKLVMFDTTDQTDVIAKHTKGTDIDYSAAMGNHKAFLISADHQLIAFPGDEAYYIYGYSDQRGFYEQAVIELGAWSSETRGLYIDDTIYVVGSETIYVLDMNSFELVAKVALPVE